MNGLNEKLKGIRHGEITLFTSGTGLTSETVDEASIFFTSYEAYDGSLILKSAVVCGV